jgi:REP element-mobilizing transposase RayT
MDPSRSPERGRIGTADCPQPASTALNEHLGWHSRGYLPHCDARGLTQSVTFRLADSLPQSRCEIWAELARIASDAKRRALAESWLDAGYGGCVLREPECARLVEQSLLHFADQRYHLLAWVIMPNHVHVLVRIFPGWPLHLLVKSWKSYSARALNRVLGQQGTFWQADYFDRFIRDEAHLQREIRYIDENPVTARLVGRAGDWPWSSASLESPLERGRIGASRSSAP